MKVMQQIKIDPRRKVNEKLYILSHIPNLMCNILEDDVVDKDIKISIKKENNTEYVQELIAKTSYLKDLDLYVLNSKLVTFLELFKYYSENCKVFSIICDTELPIIKIDVETKEI